jgi:hypothetical protein
MPRPTPRRAVLRVICLRIPMTPFASGILNSPAGACAATQGVANGSTWPRHWKCTIGYCLTDECIATAIIIVGRSIRRSMMGASKIARKSSGRVALRSRRVFGRLGKPGVLFVGNESIRKKLYLLGVAVQSCTVLGRFALAAPELHDLRFSFKRVGKGSRHAISGDLAGVVLHVGVHFR